MVILADSESLTYRHDIYLNKFRRWENENDDVVSDMVLIPLTKRSVL